MFGVGTNPVYLQRVAEREAKKQRSGQAAQESVARERDALVAGIWSAEYTIAEVVEDIAMGPDLAAGQDLTVAAAVREDLAGVTGGAEEAGSSLYGAVDSGLPPATWNSTREGGSGAAPADAVSSSLDALFAEAFDETWGGGVGSEPEPATGIAAAAVDALFRDEYAGMIDEVED
jgi:hypothetical protein